MMPDKRRATLTIAIPLLIGLLLLFWRPFIYLNPFYRMPQPLLITLWAANIVLGAVPCVFAYRWAGGATPKLEETKLQALRRLTAPLWKPQALATLIAYIFVSPWFNIKFHSLLQWWVMTAVFLIALVAISYHNGCHDRPEGWTPKSRTQLIVPVVTVCIVVNYLAAAVSTCAALYTLASNKQHVSEDAFNLMINASRATAWLVLAGATAIVATLFVLILVYMSRKRVSPLDFIHLPSVDS